MDENNIIDSDNNDVEKQDIEKLFESPSEEIEKDKNIGRLRRTTKFTCPDCGSLLEIRIIQEPEIENGEEILKDIEYYICKDQCGYEKLIEPKRRRRKDKSMREEESDYGKKHRDRNPRNLGKSTPRNNARDRGTSNRSR